LNPPNPIILLPRDSHGSKRVTHRIEKDKPFPIGKHDFPVGSFMKGTDYIVDIDTSVLKTIEIGCKWEQRMPEAVIV
jgi:hypothetical protein